jgi:opacity protein-like surface antigen
VHFRDFAAPGLAPFLLDRGQRASRPQRGGGRVLGETETVMMKRFVAVLWTLECVAGLALLAPASAAAQVRRVEPRQSIGFNLGYFAVRGEDSRVDGDVLFVDLDSLVFEVKDFNSVTFGGEWLFGVSDYLEAGLGAGFYQRTVPSVYRNFTHSDDSEIEQDLKLRIVPLTATVRFLPLGRGSVQPYVGAGIGLFNWRYSETGEFVDFDEGGVIFRNRYVAKGNAVGPVVLGGIRVPVSDIWTVGGELRYQKAEGDLNTDFLGDKIDLGGWTTSFTMHLRF